MKIKKFFSQSNTHTERMAVCKKCKFFQADTQTCGKPYTGGEVTYYGKPFKLCGCVMPIKTRLSFASCPLGKWNAEGSLPEFVDEIREAVSTYNGSYESKKRLFEIEARIMFEETGEELQWSNCGSCHHQRLTDLTMLLKRYEKC
jgi:hypothetical protein